MTGAQRSPEELRTDLGELRAELGATVDELTHRVDVPARAKAKKDEIVASWAPILLALVALRRRRRHRTRG